VAAAKYFRKVVTMDDAPKSQIHGCWKFWESAIRKQHYIWGDNVDDALSAQNGSRAVMAICEEIV